MTRMDVMTSILSTASVQGAVAATVRAGEPWGLTLDRVPGAAFHAVTSGSAQLCVGGRAPRRLLPGDVVLLPSGTAHDLVSAEGVPTRPFDHSGADAGLEHGGVLEIGEQPWTTQIVCASYDHDGGVGQSPFAALPEVVHLPALAAPPGLRASLSLIADELHAGGPGMRSVLDHVVNVVLIHVLRAWIDQSGSDERPPSWLRGLGDPTTRRAMGELHADPAFPWTVSALARRSGVSRATLTRRFESEVGRAPGEYISAWRMELAARHLRTGDATVGSIARQVGYTSEYAFNRAFARAFGLPPGRYRSSRREERVRSAP
jgi:AraC-like DNA-binding protein